MHGIQADPVAPGPRRRPAGAIAVMLATGLAPAWAADATPAALTGWAIALPSVLIGAGLAWWAAQRHARSVDELRRARDDLHQLESLLDVWLWRTDADHRLTLLRAPAGAELPGAPDTGMPLWERLPCTGRESLRGWLDSRSALHDVEVHFTAAPGAPQQRALLRGCVWSDAQGAFAGYTGTLRIVDDPVPLPPPASAAEDSERESFGYTVSHDLRAPIRVVEGFTKILKEDYGGVLDRIGNDHLDRVLGAAARMNCMIDALLTLSRLSSQPLARQPVNLSQLAGYVAEDLRRQSPERQVTLHVEPGLQVMGDPTLLRLVLENLLGNAWKYTGKCRSPEVWLERRPQHPDTYTVRDNGAGFDMRFAERLFGVFQRLHSASEFQGTGIGLATVRRIVRRHGGEVWAEAEVDRGASFHFSLPPA
ncbi:ATP-binding protein [Variovorax sp. YR752]|uniref:sensor histidine kinase n=1 Tax=Variovorax sp. YR752 TaxID=1884383 RepID=UPI0031383179